MKEQREPKIGDGVIVLRCDETPSLAGECGEIAAELDGGFYRVDVDGQAVILARADFILRK
jgi:hypothetical protein